MDATFDGTFDSAGVWDGCVGWFSSGDIVENIDAVDAAFDNTYAGSYHYFEALGGSPGPFVPSTLSATYTSTHPANQSLPSPGAATGIPYVSPIPYTHQNLDSLVTRATIGFEPLSNGVLPWPPCMQRSETSSSPRSEILLTEFANNQSTDGNERHSRSLSDVSGDVSALQARVSFRSDPPLTDYTQGEVPRRQAPRFPGDEYAATWIRSEGTEREGWCGLCSSWHKLKDSAYWYHMHYSHGISCQTGKPFESPIKGRAAKRSLGYEVLCGGCNKWLQVSRPERWRTPYYRHAYRCHAKKGDKSPTRTHSTSPRRSPSKSSKK